MNDDLLRDIAARECLPQRLPLRFASGAGNPDAQHFRHHVRHLAGRQCILQRRRDHVRRVLGAAGGTDRAPWSNDFAELRSVLVRDDDACLRATSIDTDDDERHETAGTRAGMGCVSDESIPTISVKVSPMKTYHGHAMPVNGASVPAIDGTARDIGLLKTMNAIVKMATDMPRIASR